MSFRDGERLKVLDSVHVTVKCLEFHVHDEVCHLGYRLAGRHVVRWVTAVHSRTEAVEGLWRHAIIINATYFAHLVHWQSLAPATVTHLFIVVMKASSLSLQTPPIHGFPFFTSYHFRRPQWELSGLPAEDILLNCLVSWSISLHKHLNLL
jgi:hypothetical protein